MKLEISLKDLMDLRAAFSTHSFRDKVDGLIAEVAQGEDAEVLSNAIVLLDDDEVGFLTDAEGFFVCREGDLPDIPNKKMDA